MNVNVRFCSWLFKQALSFHAAFVLKAGMTVLFVLPWHKERTDEGGRLADRALIKVSRGFDKQGGEGYLLHTVLNRGVQGQSSSVVMVDGSDAYCHQKQNHRLWLASRCHERGKSPKLAYWSQKILVLFTVWSFVLFLLGSPRLVFAHGFVCGKFSHLLENPSHVAPTSRDSLWNHDMNGSSVKINCWIV